MPGKALCLSLQPSSDYCEIMQAQAETTDAASRVRMKGNLSLAGVRDVRDSLKRLEIGSALNPTELLAIGAALFLKTRSAMMPVPGFIGYAAP